MRVRLFLASFLVLSMGSHGSGPPAPGGAEVGVDAVLQDIAARGSKAVLRDAWSDQSRFSAICKGIESGSARWLRVAVLLRPASDAGASLSLDLSVARALLTAPARVLALSTQGFPLSTICSPGFIEPGPGVERRHFERAVSALRRPVSEDLEVSRVECLGFVQARLAVLGKGSP